MFKETRILANRFMTQERQLLMLKICDFYVLKAGTERNRKSTYIYEKKKKL